MRTHIVSGDATGRLRPTEPLTAEEGAALLLAVRDVWRQEEVRDAQITAADTPRPVLAIRVGGRLYVAGDDLYGALPGTWTLDGGGGNQGQELSFTVGNGVWIFPIRLTCFVASRDCTAWNPDDTRRTVRLPVPPILARGKVLLPVGDDFQLPFLQTHVVGDTVEVAPVEDWPAYDLPAGPGDAVLVPSGLARLGPGLRTPLSLSFRDAKGARITPAADVETTFSVATDSPLRLASDASLPAGRTEVAYHGRSPSAVVAVSDARDVPEGSFQVAATVPGYVPVQWTVPVVDGRPYAFSLSVPDGASAGNPTELDVTLLDRHGRPVDASEPLVGEKLELVGPSGPVAAEPQFRHPGPTVILLFDHGHAVYRFTPPVPGQYTATVSGTTAGAPWPLEPASATFSVS